MSYHFVDRSSARENNRRTAISRVLGKSNGCSGAPWGRRGSLGGKSEKFADGGVPRTKGPVDPSRVEGRWKSEAGGSARCLVDVIMANSCQIPYYELNRASASKFVIGI